MVRLQKIINLAVLLAVALLCGNPVALANLKKGEIILDLGSGGGIDVFFASKKVGLK